MANVVYIPESEAPGIPKPLTKGAEESLEILNGIKAGMVAKITPDGSKTARGIKASLSRTARTRDIKIQVWTVEGDEAVYVKRLK